MNEHGTQKTEPNKLYFHLDQNSKNVFSLLFHIRISYISSVCIVFRFYPRILWIITEFL